MEQVVAELLELERVVTEWAEFEKSIAVVTAAEPVVAELGKALVLVGYTERSAGDHTHPAQQRHILLECVAAASVY